MSILKAGAQGWTPTVTIQPIERKQLTVGDLLKALYGVQLDTPLELSFGPLGKARKIFDGEGNVKRVMLYGLKELV